MSQSAGTAAAAAAATQASSASNPATEPSSSSGGGDSVSSATTLSSLGDLKNKAPQLYNYMMISLAQNMCTQMNSDQDRLNTIMKKMGDRLPYEG